jgi:hypothetical protein
MKINNEFLKKRDALGKLLIELKAALTPKKAADYIEANLQTQYKMSSAGILFSSRASDCKIFAAQSLGHERLAQAMLFKNISQPSCEDRDLEVTISPCYYCVPQLRLTRKKIIKALDRFSGGRDSYKALQ